jgi:lysine-specific demethylase 8
MPLGEFIARHVESPGTGSPKPMGYLAQHPLFDQIPELLDDIAVPDYCALNAEQGVLKRNAWFGPAGTVSPLHHDPYNNLLAQVRTRDVDVITPALPSSGLTAVCPSVLDRVPLPDCG